MKRLSIILLSGIMVIIVACTQKIPDDLVFIKGGSFINSKSNYYKQGVTISNFYICKYEVTQKKWTEVMENNPSSFKGGNLPVEMVNWYDCIEYCNKRSIKEGLKPYYIIDRNIKDPHSIDDNDDMKWTVMINESANGYRLPTEAEWEYASFGGQLSRNYTYSGSENVDEVAWYWQNSGDKPLTGVWNYPAIKKNNDRTQPVGQKAPNESGLYDMSGNVREWCWDWHEKISEYDFPGRVWRGGGWLGSEQACESSFRGSWGAHNMSNDTGFRVCRGK